MHATGCDAMEGESLDIEPTTGSIVSEPTHYSSNRLTTTTSNKCHHYKQHEYLPPKESPHAVTHLGKGDIPSVSPPCPPPHSPKGTSWVHLEFYQVSSETYQICALGRATNAPTVCLEKRPVPPDFRGN